MHQLAWHPPQIIGYYMGWFRNQAPFCSGETANWFYHGLPGAWTNTGSNQMTQSLQPRGSFTKNAKTGGQLQYTQLVNKNLHRSFYSGRYISFRFFGEISSLIWNSQSIGPKKPIESAACVHAHLEAGFPITQHFSSKGDPQQEKNTFQPND